MLEAADELPAGISVVICCYNSSQVLRPTLEHLADQQQTDEVPWELLIINNASTDDTAEVAEQTWQSAGNPAPMRIVFESNPGLSQARRRGVMEAKYRFVLFCDDDNWLCPSYLASAFENMSRDGIGACGGYGDAVSSDGLPDWFADFHRSYATGKQASSSSFVTNLYGAGLTVRADVLRRAYELGFESQLSDRKGNSLSSGGDGEINQWIQMFGYRLWFDERLRFMHFITSERLTWDYYIKLNRGFGQMLPTMSAYHLSANPTTFNQIRASWWYRMGFALARFVFRGTFVTHAKRRHALGTKFWSEVQWLANNRRRYQEICENVRRYRHLAHLQKT